MDGFQGRCSKKLRGVRDTGKMIAKSGLRTNQKLQIWRTAILMEKGVSLCVEWKVMFRWKRLLAMNRSRSCFKGRKSAVAEV